MAKTNKPLVNNVILQIRIPQELRSKASEYATKNNTTVSDLIRNYLEELTNEKE